MNFPKLIPVLTVIFLFGLTKSLAQPSIDTLSYLRKSSDVYAILMAKNNKLILNRYYNKHDEQSLFNDQSLTKSIVSLLIGIAIEKEYIRSADQKIADFFPELNQDTDKRKQNITIRNIMNQASGLYHEEGMFAYLQLRNPSDYVIKAPLSADPGKTFRYSNAASHLLSVILTKSTKMDTRSFAEKFLFGPLSINNFDWAKMKDDYYDGSGLLSIRLRAEDMLKIGQLVLHKGRFNNKQIVPVKWVEEIITPIISYKTEWGFDNSTYALCWYHAEYKGTKLVYGMGWGGQFMIIIPSLNAVVIVNENTADKTAVMQSDNFRKQIFPLLLSQLK